MGGRRAALVSLGFQALGEQGQFKGALGKLASGMSTGSGISLVQELPGFMPQFRG